jgi:hypothetical protein
MSEMPSLEVRAQIAKAHRLRILSETSSLIFIEFADVRLNIVTWENSPVLVAELSIEHYDNVIQWIVENLISEGIQGEYLMVFEDRTAEFRSPVPPWARVNLGSDYKWVKPIWQLGEWISILSLDERYSLQIVRDEYEFVILRTTR